jgi:uncharacterized protein involved in outer membrane biogenesis
LSDYPEVRRAEKITYILVFLLLVAIGGLLGGAHVFKDEIIAKVLSVVNEKVDVPIAVSKVDFSLIRDFPNASVLFEKVFIADRFDEADTLLQSNLMTLEFDIWDMVNGTYTIDKISLSDARLKMRTLEDGQVNYIFWKKSEESNSDMTFAIDRLELSNTDFSYTDAQAEMLISSSVSAAEMKGVFSEGWMDMDVILEGSETSVSINERYYLLGNDFAFESKMKVDESGHDIRFEESTAEVGKVKTPLNGRIFKEEQWNIDLTLDGSLEIADLLEELPDDQKGTLDDYNPIGKVDFLLTIKGESSEISHPSVDLAFDLRAGEFKLKSSTTPIRKIKSKGRYTRSEKGIDKIQFAQFEGKVPQGQIAYTGLISDFDHPYVIGDFSCDAGFEALMDLTSQSRVTSLEGNVKVDLKVRGHLPTKKFDLSSKNRLALSGSAELNDVAFELAGNGYTCRGINTTLVLEDDRLQFEALTLAINDDPVEVRGYIDGLWPFALADGDMRLVAEVNAKSIHWDQWAVAAQNESGEASALNKSIAIETNFNIAEFTYKAFIANNVTGHFALKNGGINIDPIHFNSCNGTLEADLSLIQQNDLGWATSCNASIQEVDIDRLFAEFDQFGQEFLTQEHLAGVGNAQIHFEGQFDSAMNLDLKSVRTDADLLIKNGELNGHPAMQDIVNTLRQKQMLKAFVRADELEHELSRLRFNTLKNKIKIANEVIYIPEMRIASNALEIDISGSHSFSNRIDYSMEFNLRDILVYKSNPEFYIEDDGLGHRIPLHMYGTVDDPIISLDKEKTRENRKEAIAEAKGDIREFFSDPFSSTSSDAEDSRTAVKVLMEGSKPSESKPAVGKKETPKKKRVKISKSEEDLEVDDVADDDEDF